MVRLTVVNDNPELLDLIGAILESHRHATTLIGSIRDDLLQQICRSEPDLLVIDLRHGDDARHGWDIVQQLRAMPDRRDLPVVVCSADIQTLGELEPELNAETRVAALRLPFAVDELLQSIHHFTDSQEAPTCS